MTHTHTRDRAGLCQGDRKRNATYTIHGKQVQPAKRGGFAARAGYCALPVFFKRVLFIKNITNIHIFAFGFSGFILTFIFDSLTTLSYPIAAGFDWPQTIGIYFSGIGFTILHQVSNGIIFAVGIPRVVKYLA